MVKEVITLASSSQIRKMLLIVFIAIVALGALLPVFIFLSWNHIYESQKTLITPYDFPGSVWKSEEPEIVLEVAKDSSIPSDSKCWMVCNGQQLDVIFLPGYPSRASFVLQKGEELETQDIRLLICDASFSENKVTLKVIQDNLFNGDYETITLEPVS